MYMCGSIIFPLEGCRGQGIISPPGGGGGLFSVTLQRASDLTPDPPPISEPFNGLV